jgi:hypothetical protein
LGLHLPDVYQRSRGLLGNGLNESETLAERVVERSRLRHPLEHQVALGVERHGRRGMAGDRLQEFDVCPLSDERRDGIVAQVVEAEGALEPGSAEGALELPPLEVAWVERRSHGC